MALAWKVKEGIGQGARTARNDGLTARAFAAWENEPRLRILAPERKERLPILSFVPLNAYGERIDHNAFTRALSEQYGIQARGGCSCAGPYVHELLKIGDDQSSVIRTDILQGPGTAKPGFVRLNLSVLMTDETVNYILASVAELARSWDLEPQAAMAS